MAATAAVLIQSWNSLAEFSWSWMLASFTQVALLMAILAVLDITVLRRGRASVRYAVWCLVLVKLLLPVSWGTPVSLSRWTGQFWQSSTEVATYSSVDPLTPHAVAPVGDPPPASNAQPRISPAISSISSPLQNSSVDNEIQSGASAPENMLPVAASSPFSIIQAAAIPRFSWKGWLLAAFGLIWMMLAAGFAWNIGRVRKLVRCSTLPSGRLQELLQQCLGERGLRTNAVSLRITPELASPAICGLWRPVILLPASITERLDSEQLRCVFLHEIAHWLRGDLAVNCVQTLLQVMYFHNPLVWIANSLLRRIREEAVDEAVLSWTRQRETYSSALLEVAAWQRTRVGMALRMVGVLESRHSVASRIRRLLTQPWRTSSRLGWKSSIAVLLLGVFLLPMAGERVRQAVAQESQPAEPPAKAQDPPPAEQPAKEPEVPLKDALAGQILDETGAPVADVEIIARDSKDRRVAIRARTDAEGRYRFAPVAGDTTYTLTIRAKGLVAPDGANLSIQVAPGVTATRDFKFARANQIVVRVSDETGARIEGVELDDLSRRGRGTGGSISATSNREGEVTLGGIPVGAAEYFILAKHKDFALSQLRVKFGEGLEVQVHDLVLQKGVPIKGKVLCEDGEPAAGWEVTPYPQWWDSDVVPPRFPIGEDGSFVLPHVIPGQYSIFVNIPMERGASLGVPGLMRAQLQAEEDLHIKLDRPSPKSMGRIAGRIEYAADVPQGRIPLSLEQDNRINSGPLLLPGQEKFELMPLFRQKLRITGGNDQVEVVPVEVMPPDNNVVLQVRLKPNSSKKLSEIAVRVLDDATGQLVPNFRIRLGVRSLESGGRIAPSRTWNNVQNSTGAYQLPVPDMAQFISSRSGAHSVQVIVAAGGYATLITPPVKLGEQPDVMEIRLTKGVTLRGTIVDQNGQPLDGARIMAAENLLSENLMSDSVLASLEGLRPQDLAISSNGRFELNHILPGPRKLIVQQTGFPEKTFQVTVEANPWEELKLTLVKAATIRGTVYDIHGAPQPGVGLDLRGGGEIFSNRSGGFAAPLTTDQNGQYDVPDLKEGRYQIMRFDPGEPGVRMMAADVRGGEICQLDLGGTTPLRGRLLANGAPLVGAQFHIGGYADFSGLMHSIAVTDHEGRFQIHGVPAGRRLIFLTPQGEADSWRYIGELNVPLGGGDVGDVNIRTGTLTLQLDDSLTGSQKLSLLDLFPKQQHWQISTDLMWQTHTRTLPATLRLHHVPLGSYRMSASNRSTLQISREVELTNAGQNLELSLSILSGTGVLHGSVSGLPEPFSAYAGFLLRNVDRHLVASVRIDSTGKFQVEGLPPGDYIIPRIKDGFESKEEIAHFKLGDAETRELSLAYDQIMPPQNPAIQGILTVQTSTQSGRPFPCHVELRGPAGLVTPSSGHDEEVFYWTNPGRYQLTASFPGFETIQQEVEIFPQSENRSSPDTSRLKLTMQPVRK